MLLATACVKAGRVRAWRESLNPPAPDVPDAAFVVTRLVLVTMAVVLTVTGVRVLARRSLRPLRRACWRARGL
ncbi:hypothetical protein [Streptomyces sp. NPDC016626]|uniref:hypothetical protein n=1 Tax=Streptomyces sp. NPDC016626 TaxID=3364968 RepID=UPI0036FD701E